MAKYEEALIQKIKIQYENGKSISNLSKQYSVPTGTIKTWSSTYKWVKKKNSNQPKIKTVEKRTNQPTEMEIGLLHDEDLVTDIVDEVISEEKAKKTYKVWYEVNIVDTILLIKVDNYEDFLKYSVGDKYPSLFCILSLLYQPSMNSNIASFVSS